MAEPRPTDLPWRRFSATIGWPRIAEASGLRWDDGPMRLGLAGQNPIAGNEPFGSFGGLRLPRGMAIGAGGRIFLADPDAGVILSALAGECVPGAAPFRALWPARAAPDPWHLGRPSDVALTAGGDLAIADPGTGRVLILAWPSAVIRRELRLPGWAPTALAADRAGWLIVADPGLGRIHRFDRNGRRDPDWPHGSVTLSAPDHVAVSAIPGHVAASAAPDHVAASAAPGFAPGAAAPARDCGCGGAGGCGAGQTVFVLDRGELIAIGADGRRTAETPVALLPPALRRDGARLLWDDPGLPGHAALVIPALALSRDGRLGSLPVIAVPRRIRLPRSGSALFEAFDSGLRGFAWDRIALDLTLPVSGTVVVTTLTTDAPIAPDRITAQPDAAWSRPLALHPGTVPEVLVQSAPGRYLWLRIDMMSDGSASPEIARIDLFGPRRSGLRHLPASFHQDPQSRDFLDRFLSYFDTVFAEIGRIHRDSGRLFDPAAVPEGVWLDHLGSWFDLDFLAEWPPATRRAMIAAAIDTARARGTRQGLQRMLRWHLGLPDPWPVVIEHFRLGPGAPPVARVPLPQVAEPHRITVVVPRARVAAADEPRLERLVADWIPAHVGASLRYVDTGMILGCQSLLGVDTLLSGSCAAPLGAGRAGVDLATLPPEPHGPLHSRHTLAQHDRSIPCPIP